MPGERGEIGLERDEIYETEYIFTIYGFLRARLLSTFKLKSLILLL